MKITTIANDNQLTFWIFILVAGLYFFATTAFPSADFSIIYASLKQLPNSPYIKVFAPVEALAQYHGYNLNPPLMTMLLSPIKYLSFNHAKFIWHGLMISALIYSIQINLSIFKPHSKWPYFFILLSSPVLICMAAGQVTFILLLLLMLGYQALLKENSSLCAFYWGLLCAMKLFPLLLIPYLLTERKYTLAAQTITVFLAMSILPLLIFNPVLYLQYMVLLKSVVWYSSSWNFSIMGFVFKLGLTQHASYLTFKALLLAGYLLSLGGLLLYGKYLCIKTKRSHQRFALTICFMLLLSPLGWLYYMPLLIFPIWLVWSTEEKLTLPYQLWFSVVLLMLNVHILSVYVPRATQSILYILTYGSAPFWALISLVYLLNQYETICQQPTRQSGQVFYIIPMVFCWFWSAVQLLHLSTMF